MRKEAASIATVKPCVELVASLLHFLLTFPIRCTCHFGLSLLPAMDGHIAQTWLYQQQLPQVRVYLPHTSRSRWQRHGSRRAQARPSLATPAARPSRSCFSVGSISTCERHTSAAPQTVLLDRIPSHPSMRSRWISDRRYSAPMRTPPAAASRGAGMSQHESSYI